MQPENVSVSVCCLLIILWKITRLAGRKYLSIKVFLGNVQTTHKPLETISREEKELHWLFISGLLKSCGSGDSPVFSWLL